MTELNRNLRYDRQQMIEGWDQDRLSQAVVSIVGSSPIAKYAALALAALGTGTIRLIDNARGSAKDRLLDISLDGDSRVERLGAALKKINPEVETIPIHTNLEARAAQYFLEGSDVVIEATNSIRSKSNAVDFFQKRGVPVISGGANGFRGKVVYFPYSGDANLGLLPMFEGAEQSDVVSLGLGGIIAEEAKKALMYGALKGTLVRSYDYNLASLARFSHAQDFNPDGDETAFKDAKILLIGAGALGCFLGPAAVVNLRPALLTIMDFDKVEATNLNRQVCHYDAVGADKATSLERVLKKMVDGHTEIRGIVGKFPDDFDATEKYDLIFDAVDSFHAKSLLHNYALQQRVPLISGGTDIRAATVLNYVPGQTSCLNCQIDLNQLALKAEIIRRTSCIQAPNPSVIMTNQIAGAFMVGEARSVLRPDIYGKPVNGEIKYIADFDSRGGVTARDDICDCHTREIKPLELPAVDRVKVEEREVQGRVIRDVYVDGRRL